jgi:hypothetical protein
MERHLPGIRVLVGKGQEAAGCHRTVAFRVAAKGTAGTARDRPARILADGDEQRMGLVMESAVSGPMPESARSSWRRIETRWANIRERLSPYRVCRNRRKTLTRGAFVL